METVFFNGMPMHTSGEMPLVDSYAPGFSLVAKDLSEINLHDFKGKRVVLNIFPSLDTDVCAASVRRFNKDASEMRNTVVLCVSKDLPFAASKFCVANGIDNVYTASGFRSDFGTDYGVEIIDGPLRGLYARSLVVIDEAGKVKGTSMCREITEEPDYKFVESLLR
ncbi:MAG: thiol peroxidase [Muribaculaceae bacterium]|nr:thiol peroxidase [Muribaculaceae bacterium]MDE6532376.1 thiol peroxidase [Muribaculaceae bacterium]MDE6772240.1 thiol peroxidase [Muribaculaceae bacterium]